MKIKGKSSSFLIVILYAFFSILSNNCYTAPILRIEVGQHTAMINRMAVDKEAKLLATASDDKTVRLWSLPDGSLYTTLRVPIGEPLNGALYAVAVSPDGKTVATAGKTIGSDQKFSVYIFDVEKRILNARIQNLPSDIYHLAYSKDGKYLAAAFAGGFGIRVWDSQTGKLIAQDFDYSERSSWLDFNEAGYLATVSRDGFVRLYDDNFKLVKKSILNPQAKPNSISFSHNGNLLAVGYSNALQVDIVDLNLNRINTLSVDNLLGTHTGVVTWQKNSNNALYMAGDIKASNGNFVVRHWREIDSPHAKVQDIEVSKNTVTDIISLSESDDSEIDTVFSSADPSWGGIKKDKLAYKKQANLWDARTVELPNKTFSVSDDGLKIAYSQHHDADDLTIFDVTQRLALQNQQDSELIKTLSPAIKENQIFKIKNSERGVPVLNGKKLEFNEYERSLAWAVDPKSNFALVGTNYFLRWYDVKGKEIRHISVPAEVYALNIAANGKLAVAALGDGTIRWYGLNSGSELNELVSLFSYNGRDEWIVWTNEGFFGSSDENGSHLAGYHLDKGENKRPEWIDFSQLFQIYYAPELILPKLMGQEDKIQNRLKTIEDIDVQLLKNEVPVVELTEYCVQPEKSKGFVRVSTVAEEKINEPGYFDKIKFFFEKMLSWFKSIFIDSDENTQATNASKPERIQSAQSCQVISGIGQTRGFKRAENKIQSTTFSSYRFTKPTKAVDLNFNVKPRKGGLGDIDIYVNGQIQHSIKQDSIASSGTEGQVIKLTQNISLKEGENEISIQAYEKTGGANAKSATISLVNPIRSAKTKVAEKSKLIVFTVGVNRYEGNNELIYAAKDSSDFLKTVTEKKSQAYSETLKFPLLDEQATLQNIESTFDKIASNLGKNDTVLIYLSGHGVAEQDYYFIPYGFKDDDYDNGALSQRILKENIAKLSATNKIFVFLDSCHSGKVGMDDINQDVSSFDKLNHQLGDHVFVLAAASDEQEAQDQFELEDQEKTDNGLFAYAVLKGLKGEARRARDNVIDNLSLGSYVLQKIDEITENQTRYKQKARFQSLKAGDVSNFDITRYE